MSSTRKKLKRLFKKPSSTASEAFAPRDLDRTPREFDEDGRPVNISLTQSPTKAPTQHTPARRPTPSSNRLNAQDFLGNAPTPSPPPSKARGDVGAQPHAHHTAPWAAHAAFDSWKQRKTGKNAPERIATPPTPAVAHTKKSLPSAESSTQSNIESNTDQMPRDPTRSEPPMSPPGHVHRVDAAAGSKRVGMQATQQLKAWKKRREQQSSSDHEVSEVAKFQAPQTLKPFPRIDIPSSDTPTSEKKKLPKDRVRRRAIRSKEAFLPEHARQYELEDTTPTEPAQPPPPSKAGARRDEQKPQPLKAQPEKRLTMRATIAPTAQTPAERLMWISAHQPELSDEHIVSTLSALEGTALRAGHEARRLRMLSESLLRLERNDDALQTLYALQAIVPHDAWTLLRLAETCATRADTMEAGLRWCDDALRLHPWLSQAQTLRDEIEARLQKFN